MTRRELATDQKLIATEPLAPPEVAAWLLQHPDFGTRRWTKFRDGQSPTYLAPVRLSTMFQRRTEADDTDDAAGNHVMQAIAEWHKWR